MTPDLLNHFEGVKSAGPNKWQARCPAHDDRSPSLSISNDGTKWLLYCHAGCSVDAVMQGADLTMKDLFLDSSQTVPRLVAVYKYYGADGGYCYEKRRYEPKDFRFFVNDTPGLNGQDRILYQLLRVKSAIVNEESVYLCEGEKDAETIISKGFCATTLDGGAGAKNFSPLDALTGATVVILPDQDEPGKAHGQGCANYLIGKVKEIKVVNVPKGKDVTEFFEQGGTPEELRALIKAAPVYNTPFEEVGWTIENTRPEWIKDGEPFLINEKGIATNKINTIIELVKSLGADLVIIETSSRVFPVDENDNAAGARLVGILETIRDKTGASVLVNDHSSKINRQGTTDLHGQNSLRGAGAKLDNARFGLLFEPQKRSENFDVLKITNSKTFRCRRADSFKVKVNFPVFTLLEESEIEPDVFTSVVQDVKQHPGTKQRETVKRLGGKSTTINHSFKDAVNEGLIESRGKTEGYYYVN